ncbi:MAG: 16S rRNA (guanine(527)-N(7))-methyltransferase RsmG [Candidatus Acidiferrales bacterium]
MKESEICSILTPYGVSISGQDAFKIQTYMELLSLWGKKIALTAIRQEDDILRFHFGESIFALTICGIGHGRLADVGSGAGFPGLPIKILRSELSVTLIEPNKKKCAFLHEVVRALELRDVDILSAGFEASTIGPGELSYITTRALGRLPKLLNWARAELESDGRVMLWLGVDDYARISTIPDWEWSDPVLIPGTSNRMILSGRRQGRS